ncbi:MAG TPA: sigma-70 family RNA polymerase sigma factor [Ilumatobacteraceae bacterium]|nr:sigma-70 family RNA polymerase sigma factor [Ilumatobacteraceae bacterium]
MSSEATLAASAETVDADALVAQMFAEQGGSLVRLARVFCDDRDAAEDLVQEAFIRLHRSAGSIRDLHRAPAFLRSIVINLARDHNRRGLMSLRHRGSADLPAPPVEPDERAVHDEEVDEVLDALRTLPERQRACLVLRYYEQLSIAEVAETLRISTNSVKTHCRRGLVSLESRLEPTK